MFIDLEATPQKGCLPGRNKGTACWKRTLLQRGTIYILDDEVPSGKRIKSVHAQKCAEMRSFFKKHTNYKIREVPQCASETKFLEFFKEKLRAQSDNEISIIYYHGTSGMNGEDFAL